MVQKSFTTSAGMELRNKRIAVVENHHIATTTIRAELMDALVDAGYEVIVLTELDTGFHAEESNKNIRFVNVGVSVMNPVAAIRYMKRLRRALKKIRPAVCMTFTIRPAIYGNIVTRSLKIPTISTITGTGPLFESNSFSYRVARMLYKKVLKKTRRVFFPNFDDLNAFVEHGYISRNAGIRVPGSGVNNEKFAPRFYGRVPDGKFIFLYISRLVKDKGILEFAEAASLIREENQNAEFHVIGPLWLNNKKSLTVTREELDQWIEKKWVVYHGEQKDVRPFIATADCVVMPSYREGMSNVLLEAASMASPLIATNVTGCRDIVEDGVNGLLCKPRNGKDLAEVMRKMMSFSETERKEMGKRGREKVIREFDKKVVLQQYLQAVGEVINEK
jgi:glycosyltransferase involved in cell wall biosynthesis